MKMSPLSFDVEVWKAIEIGVTLPDATICSWIEPQRKEVQINAKAMNSLFYALSPFEFDRVSSCTIAKEIWDKLVSIHGSMSQEKGTEENIFANKFESSIDITNALKDFEGEMSEEESNGDKEEANIARINCLNNKKQYMIGRIEEEEEEEEEERTKIVTLDDSEANPFSSSSSYSNDYFDYSKYGVKRAYQNDAKFTWTPRSIETNISGPTMWVPTREEDYSFNFVGITRGKVSRMMQFEKSRRVNLKRIKAWKHVKKKGRMMR